MTRIETLRKSVIDLKIHPLEKDITTYKYVSVETALKIIRTSSLLYQCHNKFNDPLDPHFSLIDFMSQGTQHIVDYDDLIPDDMKQHFMDDAEYTFGKILREQMKQLGILCLSKNHKNTLMWSHYGKNHTGVCLGFRNIDDNSDENLNAFEVKYAQELEPIQYNFKGDRDSNLPAMLNLFCTKSEDWKYEEEVRMFNYIKPGAYSFKSSSLKEVYFGVRTDEKDIKKVMFAINKRDYKLEMAGRMNINKKRFQLDTHYLAKQPKLE